MINSKVAIVTGGGQGIGAAIVQQLLAENMRVVIAEINPTHKDVKVKDDTRLIIIKTDVKSESSIKKMIQKTLSHFGRIDVLINNAGILPNESGSFEKITLKIWNDYIATNLTATFLTSKYARPYLKEKRGSIVNIASTRALMSEGNNEPYAATKGGLVSLTHELAMTFAPEIRVNCISPGWINSHYEKLRKIDHEQHPVGRVGKPEDIAYMTSFLISEKAEFITAQNFIVDGGMTVKMIYK